MLGALLFAAPAQSFELETPVQCALGETCFIQQYVDHDTTAGAHDLICSPRSYDGHKGTDFRLPDLAAMREGVAIIAAAPGRVRATRDGMPDIDITAPDAPPLDGRDCGNAVIIDHADGWSTQYCHLKQGSVTVSSGQDVPTGAVLGEVGLSGNTAFPHLHLTLRRGDTVIDPFSGDALGTACEVEDVSLWSDKSGVTYGSGGVMSAGFQTAVPGLGAVKAESPHLPTVPADAPALVFWAHAFGVEQGDILATRLTGPSGEVIAEERHVMPRNRASQYRAIGRKRRGVGWAVGTYRGEMRLIRRGQIINTRRAETSIR